MNAAKQKTRFKEQIEDLTAAFRKECHTNKKNALILKISAVCLSASVTVLLGLKLSQNWEWLQTICSNIALVFSALITILGAYEAFFDPRAVWIRETIIYTHLRNLKREFEFWAAGCDDETLEPADVEKLEQFQHKLDNILMQSLKNWMRIRGIPDAETKTHLDVAKAEQQEAAIRANDSKPSKPTAATNPNKCTIRYRAN